MKLTTKASKWNLVVLSLMLSDIAIAGISQPEYIDVMNTTAKQLEERIAELNDYALDASVLLSPSEAVQMGFDMRLRPSNSNDKYISINGIVYPITTDNTVAIPIAHWSDDSAIRNLFNFLNEDWELTWFEGGATIVNSKFGNYDYGNGCLLEYYPQASSIPPYYANKAFGLVRELETCYDGSMGDSPEEQAERFNPHHFGVHAQFANFIALEEYKNQLIVAHTPRLGHSEVSSPLIGFYNADEDISQVITTNGDGQNYQKVNDITVHRSFLYVSAVSEHGRIDVFDLETHTYQYSYLVNSTGNASILVTDDYIFVTSDEGIAVYTNVKPELHEKVTVEMLALFENSGAHSLEVFDNNLLAVSDTEYSVYDLSSIRQGGTITPMLTRISNMSAIDLKGSTLIAKQENRAVMFDMNAFLANGYEFREASKAIYLVDDFEIVAKDFLLTETGFITLNDSVITNVLTMKSIDFSPSNDVREATLSFDALPQGSVVHKILQEEQVIGSSMLEANTSSMVNVRLIDGERVEITNFTELDLSDVKLDIQAQGQYEWSRLGRIDHLPAYTQITLAIAEFNRGKVFNTVNGSGSYDFSKFLNGMKGDAGTYNNIGTKALFDSRFSTSTNHPLIGKLNSIQANWDLNFIDFTLLNDKEVSWTGEYAKAHIELLTNMAFVVSSDAFRERLLNYKALYGHDMQIAGTVLDSQAQYLDFLKVTIGENDISNVGKKRGYEQPFGIIGRRGSTFGISKPELERIQRGELDGFGVAFGKQLVANYFLDCVPTPCGWEEPHLAKLLVDVYEELEVSGELPYQI